MNRRKGKLKRNIGGWSWYYNECKNCGTKERPHASQGLCVDCLDMSERDLSNAIKCPVCGVMVNKLSQHLVMRAKKCRKHYKYQYNKFKMYFNSDLGLKDIAKELNTERHHVTNQFINYFGKKLTRERNERIRRCNISEKSVLNKNYKNVYGTLIEYEYPNQGVITLRSKLEAKFADSLSEKSWWYERDSFPYIDKNGVRRTYTPDFYIDEDDVYVEIKGNNLIKEGDLYKINWVNNNTNKEVKLLIMN
jgi:hypothetical protein